MDNSSEDDKWFCLEEIDCDGESRLTSKPASELEVFLPQGSQPEQFELGVVVRFSEVEVDDSDFCFVFGIKNAQLNLLMENCIIPPGTYRVGDYQPPPVVSRTTKREREAQLENAKLNDSGSSGGFSNFKPDATVSMKHSRTNREMKREKEITDDEQIIWFVKATTGNIWEIKDPDNWCLCARYLGDEALCTIETDSKDFSVEVILSAKPKDFAVKIIINNFHSFKKMTLF